MFFLRFVYRQDKINQEIIIWWSLLYVYIYGAENDWSMLVTTDNSNQMYFLKRNKGIERHLTVDKLAYCTPPQYVKIRHFHSYSLWFFNIVNEKNVMIEKCVHINRMVKNVYDKLAIILHRWNRKNAFYMQLKETNFAKKYLM